MIRSIVGLIYSLFSSNIIWNELILKATITLNSTLKICFCVLTWIFLVAKNKFNEFWLWGEKSQYDVLINILQLVGAYYVWPLPNAISKSPATKLKWVYLCNSHVVLNFLSCQHSGCYCCMRDCIRCDIPIFLNVLPVCWSNQAISLKL